MLHISDLQYHYEPIPVDVLEVEGIRYAGDVFRAFGFLETGSILEIVEREDKVITVHRHYNEWQDVQLIPPPYDTPIMVTDGKAIAFVTLFTEMGNVYMNEVHNTVLEGWFDFEAEQITHWKSVNMELPK